MAAPRPPDASGYQHHAAGQALAVEVVAALFLALHLRGVQEAGGHASGLEERAQARRVEPFEGRHHPVGHRELLGRIAVGHRHHLHPRGLRGQDARARSPRRRRIPRAEAGGLGARRGIAVR